MIRADDVQTANGEEALFATEHFGIADVPDGWDPDSSEDRTWGEGEVNMHSIRAAAVVREETEEAVIRTESGQEYSYKRAIERCELGTDYVIPGPTWTVLVCNRLPQKIASALGLTYVEGTDRVSGTDVALRSGEDS